MATIGDRASQTREPNVTTAPGASAHTSGAFAPFNAG